ncbi:MAG TPA: hypothetical protein VLJ59_02665 [Mycobacteriales bacterium]|nr:hypothetical protein [Mycobacteriales bacterium]
MVVNAAYFTHEDRFHLEPVPLDDERLATVSILETNTMARVEGVQQVSHGPMVPFIVEQLAGKHGLLEPTRFNVSGDSPVSAAEALMQLYVTYVTGDAVRSSNQPMKTTLQRIDDDEQVSGIIRSLMLLAPDVVPDPVPDIAALGLTLECWRHTAIEQLHSSNHDLSDVIMMKLNIATSRAAMEFVNLDGVSWERIAAILLDADRTITDGRPVGQLVGPGWPEVAQSIKQKLAYWQHIEAVLGPRATLRLLSVMGSTAYTERWWGNSWWSDLVDKVTRAAIRRHPSLVDPANEFSGLELAADLAHQPDSLPNETLAIFLKERGTAGLRTAKIERPKATVLKMRDKIL